MPPSSKNAAPAKDKDRRKSAGKPSLIAHLKVTPDRLRKIVDPTSVTSVKEESPVKESPATSTTLPTETTAAASNGENASESNPGTPAGSGTPSQAPMMGPPTEAPKKKGVKRGASGANGEPKVRGKPGPKKKPRLEDGSIDPNGRSNVGAYHKLGPKANQGAINAGLRALDRSGKPCRKWAKGGFKLKSFTGVAWEIPRWVAPPKPQPTAAPLESSGSAESSNKENKEGSQIKSENSGSAADGEQRSMPASVVAGSSPAPTPVPVAS